MGDAVKAMILELNADPEWRCVVVQGEGRAFCSGGDLDLLAAIVANRPPRFEGR